MSTTTVGPMAGRNMRALLFVLLVLVIVGAFVALRLHGAPLTRIGSDVGTLRSAIAAHPLLGFGAYFLLYVVATAVSFPGAAFLTVAAGALFGVMEGTLLVSFASSIGASLVFLAARFLLRSFAFGRFPTLFQRIDAGIARDGAFYLASLRQAAGAVEILIETAW